MNLCSAKNLKRILIYPPIEHELSEILFKMIPAKSNI